MADSPPLVPRFLTDEQLRDLFGLSERALRRLRQTSQFPRRDALIGKTDRCAVDRYFDLRSGIGHLSGGGDIAALDGQEDFHGVSREI